MDFARLKKVVGFHGRFLVSFSAVGYRARAPDVAPAARRLHRTDLESHWRHGASAARACMVGQRSATKLGLAAAMTSSSSGTRSTRPRPRDSDLTDLSLVADTRRAASAILARGAHVDVLVNNVGLLLDDLSITAEGFEDTTDEPAHALGADRRPPASFPALAPRATIIEMSSGGMPGAPLTLDYMGMRSRKYSSVYATPCSAGRLSSVKYWQQRHGSAACAVT